MSWDRRRAEQADSGTPIAEHERLQRPLNRPTRTNGGSFRARDGALANCYGSRTDAARVLPSCTSKKGDPFVRAKVYVTPKPGVLDPAGKAIESALHSLGFAETHDVRLGKYIEM